uniref:Beta-glucosidase n=1 Tax=Nakazawaea wickerhamii TaxID=1538186 RepID=Q12601_9ASCO|nr:beta-glucosidase [Nakazawaea wickerhamii]prf//2107160A beta-glucosidase [Nakazawaea wickerhamii]
MFSQKYLLSLAAIIAIAKAAPADDASKPGIGKFAPGQLGFRYYIDTTTEYATPATATAPASSTTYAAPYAELSSLVGNLSTTTWGNWYPDATEAATDTDDPYGQYAWSQLWEATTFPNFTRGIYSTTVDPTPIPTESLVVPPDDPVKRAFQDLGIKFPLGFIQGVAGSAAQIEGAVADEGRSPTNLEVSSASRHLPEDFVTNENYYLYKQDITRLAAIGVEYYSFTIPWTRILPFAYPGSPVNQQGLDHYDDLINTVLAYGMKPIVTLIHFDSPLQLVDFNATLELGLPGGYEGEDFVEAFVNYGKIVMTHFADRVPLWIIFNEPVQFATNGLGVKHVVQATAQLYDFYHNEINGSGKIGMKFSHIFGFPEDPTNPEHVAAADRSNELQLGLFADPLFLGEDYPDSFKTTLLKTQPALAWTLDELAAVKGKCDFFGVDPYTYNTIKPLDNGTASCEANVTDTYWPTCVNVTVTEADNWSIGYRSQSYVYITPRQLRVSLNYIWQHWHVPIFITEFGFPEWREGEKLLVDQVQDLDRSIYYRSFLTAALEASQYDGVEIMGALAWSFADNWEFGDYNQQFGLQVVNRTTQERFYKKSFFDFVGFINDNRA